MNKNVTIVTNNSKLKDKFSNVLFVDGDYIDVLYKVRDLVYLNYTMVNHPLAASIRMFYSPVRSIAIKKGISENSIIIIEDSIASYLATMGHRKPDYKNLEDYEFMDLNLLGESIDID